MITPTGQRLDGVIARTLDQVRSEWTYGSALSRRTLLLLLLFAIPGLPGLIIGWVLNQLLPSDRARLIGFGLLGLVALIGLGLQPSPVAYLVLVGIQALGVLVGTQHRWKLNPHTVPN